MSHVIFARHHVWNDQVAFEMVMDYSRRVHILWEILELQENFLDCPLYSIKAMHFGIVCLLI